MVATDHLDAACKRSTLGLQLHHGIKTESPPPTRLRWRSKIPRGHLGSDLPETAGPGAEKQPAGLPWQRLLEPTLELYFEPPGQTESQAQSSLFGSSVPSE